MTIPTIPQVSTVIERHERFKNAYFWTPPGGARNRRWLEAANTESHAWEFKGDTYTVQQSVTCSCRNVYYRCAITRNGSKKDIRALRALLKDLEATR